MTQSDIINNNFSKAFECIKCSNAYDTGEVLSEEKLFKQISERKYSTFDLSKFTVVGSPTITDDGVASGFSSNTYLYSSFVPVWTNTCKVKIPFVLQSIPINTDQTLLGNYNVNASQPQIKITRSNIYADTSNGTAWIKDNQIRIKNITWEINTPYTLEYYINGYKVQMKLFKNNLKIGEAEKTLAEYAGWSFGFELGSDLGTSPLTNGSIDLKQFSITVDGKEVFSGNKTGLDVIKPDNYTVVGSPTISADGVASGFSGSDYLTVNTTGFFNNNYNFEIDSKVKYTSDTTTEQEIWNFSWIFRCRIWYTNNKHRLDFYMPYGANYTNTYAYLEDYGFVDGDDLYIKCISENASSRKLMFSKDGINWNTITNTNTTDKDITSNNLLKIGQYSPTVYWLTNIDLNAFKIYVDGDLIYQPCLKIPYTQSKTGSKIVDVAYRDRVIDLYEQEGKAKYYTIDEPNKNFTLPMGEIYGMIGGSSSTGGSGLELCDIGMALYVDETKGLRRYLNGQIVDINTNTQAFLNRLQEITTLHPSLLCTEEEWQSAKTMSAFGQVGKFVFNYSGANIVSVRLPRVVNVQGLFDLQNLGMTVDESLPNITGKWFGYIYQVEGAISVDGTQNYTTTDGNTGPATRKLKFDASLSSSTYKDGATVQQEAIQYPYFIQIATGSETEANIVNTLENVNGFTLLESKYSDKPLYNESWLLSNGQWNAKAVYPTAYEGLQVEYNSEIEVGTTVTLPSGVSYTKRGLSVKLSTETYTDYDFVLNTADETFRLPLKTKLASGKSVVGNGISLGLTDANGNYFGIREGQSNPTSASDAYGVPTGSTATDSDYAMNNKAWGITTDPTKSGMELSDSGLYLYYYVGETVQNANLIDAGRFGEQLATKTDMLQASGAGMPSNKYINLTLGASGSVYTAPANGYFYINKIAGSDWYYVRMRNAISDIDLFVDAYRTTPLTSVIPAKKGENVYIYYNATGTTNDFRFIYAEGSK